MKKLLISLIVCLASLSFAQNIPTEQGEVDVIVDALDVQMGVLVDALNASDSIALSSIIADNATEEVKMIPLKLKGNTIEYTMGSLSYNPIDAQHVEATWKVSSESKGVNGEVSIAGFSHNATFEKQGDTWKIVDGSFDPTSLGSIGWILWLVFGILALIFIPLVILWMLMLIHAAKHDIHNKTTWIILMCLLGFPISVIYFFTERKRFNASMVAFTISPTNVV